MSVKKHSFKVGDSIVVKPGVKDPDLGGDIGGWQGRITEFSEYKGNPTAVFAWDSITLRAMPISMIAHCEREGLDWQVMGLDVSDIEPASPRDLVKDVKQAVKEILKHAAWLHLDEEGERIQKVLAGIGPGNTTRQLRAWKKYLDKTLTFPFEAEIAEFQGFGPVEEGDSVTVIGIADVDEHYGIIVSTHDEQEMYHFPLCDMEVTDKRSANYQPVKDYAVWFANR
ncbi:MAG: calcium-binding protein [Blastocatellia bacterium]